jgi:hypothetical protein
VFICVYSRLKNVYSWLKKERQGAYLVGLYAPAFYILNESCSGKIKSPKLSKSSFYVPGCFCDPFLFSGLSCFFLLASRRFFDLRELSGLGRFCDHVPAFYPEYGLCMKTVVCQHQAVCPRYPSIKLS